MYKNYTNKTGMPNRHIAKLWLIMRLTTVILIATFLQVSASGYSQKISLSKSDAPLKVVLKELRNQSGYIFLYTDNLLKMANPIDIKVNNADFNEVLKKVFEHQPLTYSINDKTITIKEKDRLLINSASVIDISGKVTDKNGEPIAGVTIGIKGGKTIALSNGKGLYSIKSANDNGILVFSYLGFTTQEVAIAGRTVINVKLMEEVNKLDQVVVIGYGTVSRKDLTGSVASVNMVDMAKAPVTSFDEALAGRVAGVTVSGADGQPGSVNNIVIRGPGSITQDNSPLYVVDGFPLEDSDNSNINPADIESIDILKDASSTAIYGSRGANGVIMITTKKGKKGAPVINISSYYGLHDNSKRMKMLSPYDFVKVQLEQTQGATINTAANLYTPGDLPVTDPYYKADGNTLESYRSVKGTDLQDQFFRTAAVQNYDMSVRGGSDKTLYSISANIRDSEGIIINSGLKRYQGRISLDQTINNKFVVGTNINYSQNTSYGTIQIPADGTFNASLSQMYSVWGYRPVTGLEELDLEDELFDPIVTGDDYRFNPIISAKNTLRETKATSFYANVYGEYTILKGLKLKITGAMTDRLSTSQSFNNSLTSAGSPLNSSTRGVNGSVYDISTKNLLNENTLTYRNTFNKDHSITALAGYTVQTNKYFRRGFSSSLIPNESLGIDGLDEGITQVGSTASSSWGLISYLGRINYAYKGKYLFTTSFRSDGSSKFVADNRWGYFPSAAFAWNASKESFFKNITFISNAKFRASYGSTGNNRIGDFDYLTRISFPLSSGYPYNNSTTTKGAMITAIGNPNLRWETTNQADLGVDLGFFKERISLTVDVYDKRTDNLLLNADLPTTTGVSSAFKNIGKMRNRGLEISLNTVNLNSKAFTWSTNFNISFNKNEVLSLTENQNALTRQVRWNDSYIGVYSYISMVGQPLGQMYGLVSDGLYQLSDFDIDANGGYILNNNVIANGNARTTIKPGHIKYKDINGDGIINTSDYTIIGRGLPKHTGGLTNNFSYKGFDLNVLFQWSYGNDLINANRLIFEGSSQRNLNQFATYANRWSLDNQSSIIPVVGGAGPANYSTRVIEDGSYLRLKTVSLSYNVPNSLTQKLGIKNLRVYSSAQNLITWTNYSGPDPEVSVGFSNLTQGFDYAAYPRARTIIFGLNLSL